MVSTGEETFSAVQERSGSRPANPDHWPALVTEQLWEESAAHDGLKARFAELWRRLREHSDLSDGTLGELEDFIIEYWCGALHFGALFGYALGGSGGRPEPLRLATANAFAGYTPQPARGRRGA
jgi:hypothetical protein